MGAFKKFSHFCETNKLDAHNSDAWEFYQRAEKGLPWGKHSECPECGKPCIEVTASKWHCFYCGESGQLDPSAKLTPEQERAERELREEKQALARDRALKIWNECIPIRANNNVVVSYLLARRIELPPSPDEVMRWHGSCPFGSRNKAPCIVSLFRCALTDRPMAIHRTNIISASTGKSERKALGPIAGSAIKLWPLGKEKSLSVGEGIENVLSAVKLGIADPPAWAVTVANNLSRLPVIPGVERLTICADNDASGTGQRHANDLRRKWTDQGREVRAKIPTEVGTDFNDVLRGRA